MDKNIDKIIIRVLQNIQTEEEMNIFLIWYNAQEDNKNMFFQLKNIYELSDDKMVLNDEEIKKSWSKLFAKIESKPQQKRFLKNITSANLYNKIIKCVSAAAVISIVLFTIYHYKVGKEIRWTEIKTTAHSVPQTVRLPDGSTVQLNSSSLLKYPKKFNMKNRVVYLDGEAYFQIVADLRKPFVVNLDKQQIEVLGTKFNVMGYTSDSYVTTTLITGKVRLKMYDNNKKLQNEIVIHPNQQALFNKTNNKTTISEIDALEATGWINGVYSFNDVPLGQIVQRLEKIYGMKIFIQDEKYRNEKYTGEFFSNQDIKEVIDIINFKKQFDCKISNDTIILNAKFNEYGYK